MKTQTNKNQYKIPGGTTGQALVKQSNTDYDFDWGTVSGGGGAVTITGMVAGEQIQGATSTPQACFIGDNTESGVTGTTTPQTQSPGQDVNFKTQKVARLITVTERQSVNLVEFVALKSGTPSATYKVSIQGDNSGEPDGVEATSVTANTSAFSSSASGAVVSLAFSQTAELDSGTDYWVVFETTVTDTGDWYLKYAGSADGGEETYMVYSGGVWSAGTASQWLQIQLQVKYTQALVWRSDNNVTNRQKFDMVVPADYALGATITSAVRMGEQDDFVGMTAGAEQYLSDTRGAISGSGTVVVGRAVSTTKLLVDRYNGLV